MENIHQRFKKRLRNNLVLFSIKFSIKFPAWVNTFLISFVHGFTDIKHPVMFRSTQRFFEDGPYLQVNFRVQSNLERSGIVLFFKNLREIQGKSGKFSESKNREKSGIFCHGSAFLIFLLNYLCFIYVLYIMFYFLFYLMTNNEEKIKHCSIFFSLSNKTSQNL